MSAKKPNSLPALAQPTALLTAQLLATTLAPPLAPPLATTLAPPLTPPLAPPLAPPLSLRVTSLPLPLLLVRRRQSCRSGYCANKLSTCAGCLPRGGACRSAQKRLKPKLQLMAPPQSLAGPRCCSKAWSSIVLSTAAWRASCCSSATL
jgi:hypothetical protein